LCFKLHIKWLHISANNLNFGANGKTATKLQTASLYPVFFFYQKTVSFELYCYYHFLVFSQPGTYFWECKRHNLSPQKNIKPWIRFIQSQITQTFNIYSNNNQSLIHGFYHDAIDRYGSEKWIKKICFVWESSQMLVTILFRDHLYCTCMIFTLAEIFCSFFHYDIKLFYYYLNLSVHDLGKPQTFKRCKSLWKINLHHMFVVFLAALLIQFRKIIA